MSALRLARDVNLNMLIVDLDKPTGNGFAIREMLCNEIEDPRFPIIFLNGKTNEHVPPRCNEMGVHYVLKSTNPWERLAPLLENVFDFAFNTTIPRAAQRQPSPNRTCLLPKA